MTVRELIDALLVFDPDLPVWAEGDDRECPIGEPEMREAHGVGDGGMPRRVTL
jgi:hypothetical protein